MWELLLAAILTAVTVETSAPPPTLADLPRGAPPSVAYVVDGERRGPDGRRVALPDRHGISAVTPYDGGFLVADTRYFEMSLGLAALDVDGRMVGDWTSSGSPATAADGRTAWTSFAMPESGLPGPSLVHVGRPDGTVRTTRLPGHRILSVAGFAGRCVVVNDPATGVRLLDCAQHVRRLDRLGHASDATTRLVAGDLATGRANGVVDARSGDPLWRTRATDLTFSPSGRRVVGRTRDGLTVFRSSDGSELWRAELPRRAYAGTLTWEDERHVLAVTQLRNQTAVLRCGADGTVELATRIRPSDFNDPPYVLATRA